MSKIIDLTGEKIGKLTVIKKDNDTSEKFYKENNQKRIFWVCECECGNTTILDTYRLSHKITLSCGCLNRTTKTNVKNRNNTYKLYKNYGVCTIIQKNIDFIFDLDDYDKIKKYTWNITDGYIVCNINRQTLFLGNFILQTTKGVNYKNENKLDNRKYNLRLSTRAENIIATQKLKENNTSGFIGVCWRKNENRWKSYISVNGKQIHLGYFKNKEDAIEARKQGENKYYNEFSKYQNQ